RPSPPPGHAKGNTRLAVGSRAGLGAPDALDRAHRDDGGGKILDRTQARRAAGHSVRGCRCRDRGRRRHDHRGYFRSLRRGVLPFRRDAGDRTSARGRAAGAGDRRRRLHEPGDARHHPPLRHLGVAEGRFRRVVPPREAAQRSPPAQDRRPGGNLAQTHGRARSDLRPGGRLRAFPGSAARDHRRGDPGGAGRPARNWARPRRCSRSRQEIAMTAPLRSSEASVVHVALGARGYDVVIGRGALASLGERIAALKSGTSAAIVTDSTVASHHLAAAEAALERAGVRSMKLVVPAGESSKTWGVLEQVCEGLIAARVERGDVVVALGGGVIGDLAALAAALVRRGLEGVQGPPTLPAPRDSALGGKTAINSRHGKNLIGVFHQPSLVVADTALLDTLPLRAFRAGYAEVVKYGLINDAGFFAWLETNWHDVFARTPARERAIA